MQKNSYKFILVFLFLALTMSFVSAHAININFYDENSLSAIPTVTITDTNGSTYTSDVNGLWTADLTGAKSFEISKTGYGSRPFEFYFTEDANYNFLLNPTGLDSSIGFIVKDSNNNLWTNKYLMFKQNKININTNTYLNTSNNVSSSFTFNLLKSAYIESIEFNTGNSGTCNSNKYIYIKNIQETITYCSVYISSICGNSTTYLASFNNCYLSNSSYKVIFSGSFSIFPIKADGISSNDYISRYSTGDILAKVGSIGNIKLVPTYGGEIINSLLTSSSGTGVATLPITSFVNNDYNALLYDETGTYIEPATLVPYLFKLNFSEDVNGTVSTSNRVDTFTNVDHIVYSLNSLPTDEKVSVAFNENSQFYEFLNDGYSFIDQNIFVYDVNLTEMGYMGIGTRESYNFLIENAIVKDYIQDVNNNGWKLTNQRLTDSSGKVEIYTKPNLLHYITGSKNGYDDDFYLGDVLKYYNNANDTIWLYLNKTAYSFFNTHRLYLTDYLNRDENNCLFLDKDRNLSIVFNTIFNYASIKLEIYEDNVLVSTTNSTTDYLFKKHFFNYSKDYNIIAYINDSYREHIEICSSTEETISILETEDIIEQDLGQDPTMFIIFIVLIIIISAIFEFFFGVGLLVFFILAIIISIWESYMLWIMAIAVIYILIQIIKRFYGD